MVDKQKARTVAKGLTQVLGEDYDETYALVACLESVRLICAIVASRKLRLWQIDFVLAFLNSESSFNVYMEQPKGFEKGEMVSYGNFAKRYMIPCRVSTTG